MWAGVPGLAETQAATGPSFVGEQVGAAYAGGSGFEELGDEVVEPVALGEAVVVGVRDDLAAGELHPDVAGHGEAAVALAVVANPREPLRRSRVPSPWTRRPRGRLRSQGS